MIDTLVIIAFLLTVVIAFGLGYGMGEEKTIKGLVTEEEMDERIENAESHAYTDGYRHAVANHSIIHNAVEKGFSDDGFSSH